MAKKVALIILVIITVFNLILPEKSNAADSKKENVSETMNGVANDSVNSILYDGQTTANPEDGPHRYKISTTPSVGGATASAIARFLNIIPTLVSSLMDYIVSSQQINGKDVSEFTIQDLLRNKYDLFNINFFANVNETEKVNGMLTQNIVIWYSAIRNLAIGITLLVLVYIGIRMAMSTVADDKAKYKKMLTSWFVGFCLIFVVNYVIIVAINLSNALIDLVPESSTKLEKDLMYGDGGTTKNPEKGSIAYKLESLKGWNFVGIVILYWVLVYYQIKFFILYFTRLINVGFLVVISPIIAITYPIDAVGDGEAQGFQNWMRDMLIAIFIQPIHLIIFSLFIETAGEIALTIPVIGALFLMALSRGEKIVKNVFGIRGSNTIKSLGSIKLHQR